MCAFRLDLILITCLTCISLITCVYAEDKEEFVKANLETPFQLKSQQTAMLQSENIQIKFLNVTQDSRCPSDVNCVWEGLVTVVVNIQQNNQDLGNFKLTQRGGQEKLAVQNFVGQKIDLVEVNPYPKSTKPIQLADYVITLIVSNTSDRTIIIPSGTAKPGCEDKKICYFPSNVTIPQNTEITWKNMDSVAHTVTSGTIKDGPDDVFSSGLILPGETFSYKFTTMRPYDYYCMIHPWMTGLVNVEFIPFDVNKRIITKEGTTSDGSIVTIIQTTEPINTEQLGVHVYFKNSTQSLLTNVNYDLEVIQNNKTIFSLTKQYSHSGIAEHWTKPLLYDSPVDIKVKILGTGLPNDEYNWIGPKDDIIMFYAVPEFPVAYMILSVSIMAILMITKTRLNKI